MQRPPIGIARALPLLLLVAACQDVPTQPQKDETASPPVAVFTLAASPEEAANLGISLGDATSRLLPVLGEADDNGLGAALGAVSDALEGSDAARLHSAVGRARQVLARMQAQEEGAIAAADLDAIGLVLGAAAAATQHGPTPPVAR